MPLDRKAETGQPPSGSRTCLKDLSGIHRGTVVIVWCILIGGAALMTYGAWTEDGLDWYFAIGPTIGLAALVVGGIAASARMEIRRRGPPR